MIAGGLARWALLALAVALMPATPVKGEPTSLPNLIPMFQASRPWVSQGASEEFEAPSRRAIRFSTFLLNAGPGPLEIRGVPGPAGATEDPKAEQCVSFDEKGLCATYEDTGSTLHWYTPHYLLDDSKEIYVTEPCYAFEALVAYELRTLIDGVPDMSEEGLEVSHLVGYNLEDERRSGDYPDAGPPTYAVCLGAGTLRQGLSPGHMRARYSEERSQFVDLASRNGQYALVIKADPLNHIQESNEGDNLAVRRIEVLGPTLNDLDQSDLPEP